jgi:hypothetical protein
MRKQSAAQRFPENLAREKPTEKSCTAVVNNFLHMLDFEARYLPE